MRAPPLVRGLLLLGGLLLAACTPPTVPIALRFVTGTCLGTPPLQGATHLRFRVLGDGQLLQEALVKVSDREAELRDITPGSARVVEVRAFSKAPDEGGDVVAFGQSLPFDVPAQPLAAGERREVTLFLRRVDVFTAPNHPERPAECLSMHAARAGHTATLLPDGRVLVAGGYTLKEGGERTSLGAAELYVPASGTFEPGPALSPRAFHTATLLANGQVLLAGGEEASTSGRVALAQGVLFNPGDGALTDVQLAGSARFRHAAVKDGSRVLLLGGLSFDPNASVAPPPERTVRALEWFDENDAPESDATTGLLRFRTRVSALEFPREGMNALTMQGGKIAVLGGTTPQGSGPDSEEVRILANQAALLAFVGADYSVQRSLAHHEPRREAMAFRYRDEGRVLLVGGFQSAREDEGASSALQSSELLVSAGANATLERGATVITPRAEACSVSLEDGRILLMGGRRVDGMGSPPYSDVSVELIDPRGAATPFGRPPLPEARHQHTCTRLHDGSILVLGGRDDTVEEASTVSNQAWIFMPKPLD